MNILPSELLALKAFIRGALQTGKIENPDLETRWLLSGLAGISDAALFAGNSHILAPEILQRINDGLARRLAGEPLSRVLGEREFWSLPFTVTPDVLDPRPDTETIIDAALKIFAARPPARILDLGTGSGCLLVTLLHLWPGASGVGIDLSPAAVNVALGNARRNGVAARANIRQGNWGEGLAESFDLIVSNPPYIRSGDIPHLESSVRNFDPILALDGGKDGFAAYVRLVDDVKKLLAPDGVALLEVGQEQAIDVMRLGAHAGFERVDSFADLAGIDRVVMWRHGDK